MRNNVAVHRIVKNVKQRGQYIEPHSHTFFHYIYSLRGHTRVTADGEVYQTESGSLVLLPPGRSEEHTSELQSPYVIPYAVFCLKKTR